jgi:hypothetical protein
VGENILEAVEASRFAASNVQVVIEEFELVPVEEVYEE